MVPTSGIRSLEAIVIPVVAVVEAIAAVSVVVTPFELCKRAARIQEFGADMISLVDSAGGMLPDEVGSYMQSLKECLSVRVGFHGHNNLLNRIKIPNKGMIFRTCHLGHTFRESSWVKQQIFLLIFI